MDDQEFATVAKGAVAGLCGSLALVLVWLYLAVRSWRLMVPIMATLMLGLLLTTGFAALAIGTLNLVSVAFAVLFAGIAVDFAIQFTVRLRERRVTYPDLVDAMRETGRRSGAQILVAALATASGFLAFTPTKFVGVAQLGVIAGAGMLIAFLCTLTFLPAMLCLCRPKREKREVGFAFARALDPVVHRAPAIWSWACSVPPHCWGACWRPASVRRRPAAHQGPAQRGGARAARSDAGPDHQSLHDRGGDAVASGRAGGRGKARPAAAERERADARQLRARMTRRPSWP